MLSRILGDRLLQEGQIMLITFPIAAYLTTGFITMATVAEMTVVPLASLANFWKTVRQFFGGGGELRLIKAGSICQESPCSNSNNSTWRVVWRPRPSLPDTLATRKLAWGIRRLMVLDFPTPEAG